MELNNINIILSYPVSTLRDMLQVYKYKANHAHTWYQAHTCAAWPTTKGPLSWACLYNNMQGALQEISVFAVVQSHGPTKQKTIITQDDCIR